VRLFVPLSQIIGQCTDHESYKSLYNSV